MFCFFKQPTDFFNQAGHFGMWQTDSCCKTGLKTMRTLYYIYYWNFFVRVIIERKKLLAIMQTIYLFNIFIINFTIFSVTKQFSSLFQLFPDLRLADIILFKGTVQRYFCVFCKLVSIVSGIVAELVLPKCSREVRAWLCLNPAFFTILSFIKW